MPKPSAKRRTAARRLLVEMLETRTLLSTTADGTVAVPAPAVTEHIALTPNDPEFNDGNLWGLSGTYGVNAPGAWDVTTGSPATVTIADIDTGADYDHPDLYQNIWINQPEIPASRMANLTDVYHDGYISWRDLNNPVNIGPGKITDVNGDGVIDAADILSPMILNAQGQDTGQGGWANPNNTQDGDTAHPDDLIGWNFINNTNNPLDDNGHGTHTAGIIAASGNNGVGVVGVDWTAQVMVLKFLNSSGSGTDTAAAAAIDYAARHGAKVANASWGDGQDSPAIESAIASAGAEGMVFVAAAGNNGANTDSSKFYPADSSQANVISVGAIQSDGTRPSFSNYGAQSVDLSAPGVNIESTLPNGRYGFLSGTSMAAPFVTGTVALVEGLHPSWSVSQVISDILATTTPDPSLAGASKTGGILDAAAAVAPVSSGTASFAGADASTLGAWRSAYGGDGYDIAQDTSGPNPALPPYAQVSVVGANSYTWGTNTGNPDALRNAADSGDIAATWYSGSSFDIDVSISDGQAHRVALYAFDWDHALGSSSPPRAERFDIIDRNTGQLLDSQTISSFTGEYLSWDISGSVIIRVTDTGPPGYGSSNAVVGGLFFGGASAASGATAAFAGADASTLGAWRGSYGGDGYDIAQDTSGPNPALPPYAQVAVAGANSYTWGTNTGLPVALQDAANNGDIAATWYSGSSFDIDVAISDGQAHRVALYALDWDNALGSTNPPRAERFDIIDRNTGALLDSQTISSFTGEYLSWDISGSVIIRVTDTGPPGYGSSNAVVSGIFFGGAAAASGATAAFAGADTTTLGAWRGAYGGDGYDIASDASDANPVLPPYAQVAVVGASPYTWGTDTGSPDALRNAADSGDIAATWYSGSSFDIDVSISDGQAHRVALYAFDWDHALGSSSPPRAERFDVLNRNTGALLDSQTISSFTGEYLSWDVSGSVIIRVTYVGPAGYGSSNAVVSGIFFGDPSQS
jgi:subtilisin family serine protease